MTPPLRPYRLPNWAGFTLAVALFWLGGQFVTQGVSDEMAGRSPELAVLWRGDSAHALGSLARARLDGNDPSGAARLARRALQRSPLEATALTTYGLAQARLGQPDNGQQALEIAGKLGWRDVIVQVWLLRSSLLKAKAQEAVLHLDAILRREDPIQPALLNVAELISHDQEARTALAARLVANPSWRVPLFFYLTNDPKPGALDVERQLLRSLTTTSAPPTDAEVAPYLVRLLQLGRFTDAQADWRQIRRVSSRSLLYNGDFGAASDGTPFDWSVGDGQGWSAAIGRPPDGSAGGALRVEYDGVSSFPPVRQLVILAPGRYQLALSAQPEIGDAGSVLSWTVACADSGTQFGQLQPQAASGRWTRSAVVFEVPAGCRGEWVGVTAQPGERPASSVVWYRDVQLTPLALAPGHS